MRDKLIIEKILFDFGVLLQRNFILKGCTVVSFSDRFTHSVYLLNVFLKIKLHSEYTVSPISFRILLPIVFLRRRGVDGEDE